MDTFKEMYFEDEPYIPDDEMEKFIREHKFTYVNDNGEVIPEEQLIEKGIEALAEKLGIIGTIKFLEQFDNGGSGDCVKEKYERYEKGNISAEEFFEQLKETLE